jgi:hypothetical protein
MPVRGVWPPLLQRSEPGRVIVMKAYRASVAVVLVFGLSTVASAQRGVGDRQGVARQPAKPEIVSLCGKMVRVETAPCEMTTGPSLVGAHFVLKMPEGKKVNIHLGPAPAVEFVTKDLSKGQKIEVEAFRTAKMAKDQYVARTLTFGSRTVELRDETLRPTWAGQGGPARGQGWGRGRGYGRGRVAGWERQNRQAGRYRGRGW